MTFPVEDYDAVVIGAGFAGLYALHRLRNGMGLNVLVADRFDLRRSIALNTTCDGARRDVASSRRTVRPGERTVSARFLITATGGTGDPDIPDLACFDRFSGAVAHTLTWPEDLEDQGRLRGPVRGRPDDHGWRDRRRSRRFRP
jgi:cation diffusion facilitator CzcD-associated flavoprotein CzcO